MSSTTELKLCQVSTELDDAWRQLYESAFPANEREPETRIAELLKDGKMLLHKTVSATGDLLCFSLVSNAPDFHFLAYIATSSTQRSGGFGSKHMKQLNTELKAANAASVGLFLEIDKTNPKTTTLSEDEKKIRNRRLGFYRRLGAKKLCRGFQFLAPSKSGDGSEVELELLFISYAPEAPSVETKRRVVLELYQRFYNLDTKSDMVNRVLSQFGPCNDTCHEDTESSTPAASGESTTQAAAATADDTATKPSA